jgi:hypothetical protein
MVIFLLLARGRHVSYGDVPTWLTFIVAVVGIVGVVRQLRLSSESAEIQVYQDLIRNSSKIDEILVQRPALRRYLYDGAAVPRSVGLRAEAESLIELAVDMLDNLAVHQKYVPESARRGWDRFEKDLLKQPVVIEFVIKHGSWYSGLSDKHGWPEDESGRRDWFINSRKMEK